MELHKLLHHRIGGIKSSIHSEQLEDKIAKLERRNEPLNHQTPQSYNPQQNLCAKIIRATGLEIVPRGSWPVD